MKTQRLNLSLSAKAETELDEIATDLDMSRADVVRKGLVLMRIANDARKNGFSLAIVSDDRRGPRKILDVLVGIE